MCDADDSNENNLNVDIDNEHEYNNYYECDKEIYLWMIYRDNMSHTNEHIINIEEEYKIKILPMSVYFNDKNIHFFDDEPEYIGIDCVKASCLKDIAYFPVFNLFDKWLIYKNEKEGEKKEKIRRRRDINGFYGSANVLNYVQFELQETDLHNEKGDHKKSSSTTRRVNSVAYQVNLTEACPCCLGFCRQCLLVLGSQRAMFIFVLFVPRVCNKHNRSYVEQPFSNRRLFGICLEYKICMESLHDGGGNIILGADLPHGTSCMKANVVGFPRAQPALHAAMK